VIFSCGFHLSAESRVSMHPSFNGSNWNAYQTSTLFESESRGTSRKALFLNLLGKCYLPILRFFGQFVVRIFHPHNLPQKISKNNMLTQPTRLD
jgi:hypothetical protein